MGILAPSLVSAARGQLPKAASPQGGAIHVKLHHSTLLLARDGPPSRAENDWISLCLSTASAGYRHPPRPLQTLIADQPLRKASWHVRKPKLS